jgi:hypothetical protein
LVVGAAAGAALLDRHMMETPSNDRQSNRQWLRIMVGRIVVTASAARQ